MWPTCTTEPIALLDSDGKPLDNIKHSLTEDELRRMYHLLLLTRKVDERAWTLVRQGKAYFYAPSSGQEAAQIGSAFCLTKEDWVFPAHRDLGVTMRYLQSQGADRRPGHGRAGYGAIHQTSPVYSPRYGAVDTEHYGEDSKPPGTFTESLKMGAGLGLGLVAVMAGVGLVAKAVS